MNTQGSMFASVTDWQPSEPLNGSGLHVIMYSGGAGSWATAKRVAANVSGEVVLLFADTKMEDEDLHRFLDQSSESLGLELVTIADGRDPWQVFTDVRFMGNTRVDPCSRVLKRELLDRWMIDNCDPETTTIHLGIDWQEAHRYRAAKGRMSGWEVRAPMVDASFLTKDGMLDAMRADGIEPPRLYAMGFPHNNCGGFCVKAGQAHFRLLLEKMPERYAYHEAQEEALRRHLEKDVAVMRDRSGGETKPLTMRAFRERIQGGDKYDQHDWGGCGCFSPVGQ